MASPATNPKIEELRFRLKTDPKSRLFYQLGEELRRSSQYAEAEAVLRYGLVAHPTYLAAWVSLGRVLREQKNETGAVEALNRALQLDPGNAVAARLLADAYLALGEKVEAVKKYKLVYALLPADEDLRATIERLESDTQPPAAPPAADEESPLGAPAPVSPFALESAAAETTEAPLPHVAPPAVSPFAEAPAFAEAPVEPSRDAFADDSPFDKTVPPFALDDDDARDRLTGDAEPMLRAHDESPFEEEPAPAALADALAIEAPAGIQVESAPVAAETPAPLLDPEEADVFAPAEAEAVAAPQDITDTLTMADLYARQGLVDEARTIYEHILAREPENVQVREKLAALAPAAPVSEKVEKLERWLARVSRREVGRV
ncbi:MAG TPA: tetratricopeptide repeat protein [Thermoanaerobaculia bacterium]|nr:tetratricopeptide repeat protein [Thermoanaerobaculia bacterium]